MSNSSSSQPYEVTDPITHTLVTVRDETDSDLYRIPPTTSIHTNEHDKNDTRHNEKANNPAQAVPPVNEFLNRSEPRPIQRNGMTRETMYLPALAVGFGFLLSQVVSSWTTWKKAAVILLMAWAVVGTTRSTHNARDLPGSGEYQPPDASGTESNLQNSEKSSGTDTDERVSVAWLNSVISSLWPIINPDLFVPISDMLEDAMQASLPKLVHGVRIADIGQGSEPMRIIAAKPIPTEGQSNGQLGPTNVEGDFVNLEVTIAYRARSTEAGGLKTRAQNAHLLIEFWTMADVRFPVWIELQGLIATLRVRLQLMPNPPFFAHGTVTFLGQPKVVVAAKPLSKNFINVMDVPGLAAWVQSNIDTAVSQYVAPRSLTLDLKTLLSGADKIDTEAVGVITLTVHSAIGFKDGDDGKFWASRDGKRGDLYVIVSWAKWGKPLWSTRIIRSEAEPIWNETTAICVAHADLNAHERLRLTLWDSDRFTADDCLGIVEVPLIDIMHHEESRGKIQSRQDSLKVDDKEQGTLRWHVGYFNKVNMVEHLGDNSDANLEPTIHDLATEAKNQLREAQYARGAEDIEAQERVVMKDASYDIMSKTPPSDRWPSGILRIEIQQIHGLEVEDVRGSGVKEIDDEGNEDLPSAYCTVIINHARVYKTRTKIKSNSPYFGAATEQVIRDWRNTSVMISVHDARSHENNPILGVVVLPLREILAKRSQVADKFPLGGGLGYGRMQLNILFRAIELQLPRELRGWDIGTLDISPRIKRSDLMPPNLTTCRIVMRTLYGKGKFRAQPEGGWKHRRDRPVRLPVMKRYASCLLILFRKNSPGRNLTEAFTTLWLKDILDGEQMSLALPVYRFSGSRDLAHAYRNANTIDKLGEQVGTLELDLCFWPGLSGHHQKLSSKNDGLSDTMQALDCAEEVEGTPQEQEEEDSGSDSDSSSGSDSDDDDDHNDKGDSSQGNQGIMNELREHRHRVRGLHRKHRGLMQWKGVRQLVWAKHETGAKMGKLVGKATGRLSKRKDGDDMDTEA